MTAEIDATQKGWMPNGRGLPEAAIDIMADRDMPVHLRLTSPGVATEVNCPACLEVVHA